MQIAVSLWLLAVLLSPLNAGPLGFADLGLVDRTATVPPCGTCTFVATFEAIPVHRDTVQEERVILGVMGTLGLMGLAVLQSRLGLRFQTGSRPKRARQVVIRRRKG